MKSHPVSRAARVGLLLLGAALSTSTALAQTPVPRPIEPLPAPVQGKPTDMLEGSVKRVDPAKGMLEVSAGPLGIFGKLLEVNASTQVQVDGRQGSVSDLQEGSKVNVSYEARDGKNIATRIEVMPAQ
jgi:protein-disulfide isomerase